MSYTLQMKRPSEKLKGLSHIATVEYLRLAEAEHWHREMANLLRKTKGLRREVDLLARRNENSQRQINELVTKLQSQPPPTIPHCTRPGFVVVKAKDGVIGENEGIERQENVEEEEEEGEGKEGMNMAISGEKAGISVPQILPTELPPPHPPSSPIEDKTSSECHGEPSNSRILQNSSLKQSQPQSTPTPPPLRERGETSQPLTHKKDTQPAQTPPARQGTPIEPAHTRIETNDKAIWDRIIKEINENKEEVRKWFKENPLYNDVGYYRNVSAIHFWANKRGEVDKNKHRIILTWPPTQEGRPGHVIKRIN